MEIVQHFYDERLSFFFDRYPIIQELVDAVPFLLPPHKIIMKSPSSQSSLVYFQINLSTMKPAASNS